MIRLPKPTVDIEAYIAQVVQERQAGINAAYFSEIEGDWKARCTRYDLTGGDGALLPSWEKALGQAVSFGTLYSKPLRGSVQEPHITGLRDRTLQFCPMCGEGGAPNTLDHFLPQETYPDFSILPMNLVPACDSCQGHKLNRFVGQSGRLFLHPYYDTFLDQQVVRLRIHPPYATATPELVCDPNLQGSERVLVEHHLTELQLGVRFLKFFTKDYIRLLRLVERARVRGKDVIDAVTVLLEHAADRSVNCWEHVLYEGALSDPGVREYLRFGELPTHL